MLSAKKAFTLIELLVVVLIIGVLVAVALPKYQRTVEKARMAEAVTNVRAIANAHQVYYLGKGEYLGDTEMDKLDVTIPGALNFSLGANRIKTKYFIYSPSGGNKKGEYLGVAQRLHADDASKSVYYIYITKDDLQRVRCYLYSNGSATDIQKELCRKLNSDRALK